jgi:hypothetical protein
MTKTSWTAAGHAALACALTGLAAAPAAATDITPGRIYVRSGTNPADAFYQARLAARSAELRARWVASGHNPAQDAPTTPAIVSGAVLNTTVTIGVPSNYPTLTVRYNAGTAGLSAISAEFVSPNGKTLYAGGYSQGGYTKSGTTTFALTGPLSLYSQPGTWKLYSAAIFDNAGNSTVYDQAGLASLFSSKSFKVINTGTVDDQGPRVYAGTLGSGSVSLSDKLPTLKATVTASDHGSGLYLAYMLIQPPGQTYSEAEIAPVPLPLSRAKLHAYSNFSASDPTGTWAITGFAVCDFAQNCVGSNDDSAVVALFGTDNFTVTP